MKLREIRKEKGLSIRALSEESGVSTRTIEDIERRGDCRLSTAKVLAQALGVTLDKLAEQAGE